MPVSPTTAIYAAPRRVARSVLEYDKYLYIEPPFGEIFNLASRQRLNRVAT